MATVDTATRSRMLGGIRAQDTKPEFVLRRYLHSAGSRYRLHRRDLRVRPDILLPRIRSVALVHGCFWHRHRGCRFATTPASNVDFWRAKFNANTARDRLVQTQLQELGWGVLVVWECEARDVFALENLVRRLKEVH